MINQVLFFININPNISAHSGSRDEELTSCQLSTISMPQYNPSSGNPNQLLPHFLTAPFEKIPHNKQRGSGPGCSPHHRHTHFLSADNIIFPLNSLLAFMSIHGSPAEDCFFFNAPSE
ncbi:hypothetical protein GOODEAATRI_029805 [Goodea atripinnis]|uniref:Uncharacterized protein n=1 Tax=Goodea atripinnis TaxID=208336 RepID=A0ABV0PI87_9TELE